MATRYKVQTVFRGPGPGKPQLGHVARRAVGFKIKPNGPGPGDPGRPRKEIDWDQVAKMAENGATAREIAAACGVSQPTLRSWPQFLPIYHRGYVKGNLSLRASQMLLANKYLDGNMLKFLGKNRLGQRDLVEHEGRYVSDPLAESNEVQANLNKLTTEELTLLLALKRKMEAGPPAQLTIDVTPAKNTPVKANGRGHGNGKINGKTNGSR